ncbi:MAG: HD domain-containing protein [Chloroflexi bacterium]|nr:HD domain-containing protein [Chloroflexota bacterium]
MDDNAYSGRWVARLRGKIVAQGGTPEQARRAALSRFKEKPEIVYMPTSDPLNFPPLLDKVLAALPADQTVYLVGGAVRDLLLGRAIHDFDFALARGGIPVARKVANALQADFYPLDPERDTGRVLVAEPDGTRTVLDFAAFRGPDPSTGSGPSLDADLQGRDFTLNAIALDLRTRQVFDPLGGALDLREKRLRACSPSAFHDDPVRILRGVRLAADFGFRILPETRQAMKTAAARLAGVSSERVRDELFRILEGPAPAACVRALDILGALAVVLPELAGLKGISQPAPHVHDVWEHTLATLAALETILVALAPDYNPEKAADLFNGLMVLRIGRYRQQIATHLSTPLTANRTPRGLLFLAALYHDVAKPHTKKEDDEGQLRFWDHDQQGAEMAGKQARLLALSNEETARLETVIRNHMRILFHGNRLLKDGKPPTRRAVYRFFRDAGPGGVELCLLALADMRATYDQTLSQETWAAALDVVRLLLENWYEKPAESIAPPLLVDGNDLMRELSLKPGPKIGELLEAVREAQAMGEVSTREQALELARKRIS